MKNTILSNMKTLVTAIAFYVISLQSLALAQSKPEFPSGWKPAVETDYSVENLSFTKNQAPSHIKADFNGDSIPDHAWILVNNSEKSFGLFVFQSRKDGSYETLALDEQKRITEKLSMGISFIEPGQYKTACGKGYWVCKDKEPAVLTLKLPGINYFLFESANSVFFWYPIKKKFSRIWMSD